MERIDTTATVETPERVRFRYRLAGPAQRAAAFTVDLGVQLAMLLALVAFLAAFSTVPGLDQVGQGVFMLGLFALTWLYGVFFETWLDGRTPGKLVLRLRVVKVDGAPARFPDFVLRNLVRAADFLPSAFGLGVLVMAADERQRRFGDWVAATVVVVEDRSAMHGAVRIDPPVTEAERQAMPARVHLAPQELDAIEAFLRRRRSLSTERAEELAKHFGPALSQRTGIVAPTWERVLVLAYARATGKDRDVLPREAA